MSTAPLPATPVGYRVVVAPDTSLATVLGATERLKQSRRLLCAHMQALNAAASEAQENERRQPSAWYSALKAVPGLGPLIDTVSSWWAKHPLRVVADLFASSTASAAKPMTQTRPWTMLLLAVAVGGLLVWARPWRFALLRRAVYAGVLPQLVSSLMSRLPINGWLDIVNSLLRRPGAAATASPTASAPTTSDTTRSERPAQPQPTAVDTSTTHTSLH